MKSFIFKALASGLGLGYLPLAPGTYGTLLGIPLAYAAHQHGPYSYLIFTVAFAVFSIFIAEGATFYFGEDDSPKIVIDEIAGYIVAMTWLPMTWQSVVLAFVLFRFFDAVKPGPIGYLDKKIKGGLGVVCDDLAAGIVSNVILQIIYTNTSWLGTSLS